MNIKSITYSIIIVLLSIALLLFMLLYFRQLFSSKFSAADAALTAENTELKAKLEELRHEYQASSEELSLLRSATATPEPTPAPALPQLELMNAGDVLPADSPMPEDSFICKQITPGDGVYEIINGRSYVENEHISLSELRYIKLLHYNFDGSIQVGELIVNVALVQDLREIFAELFKAEYQIQSLALIENYWTGDGISSDYSSIDANNSSAFCYREVVSGGRISQHALGRAIDINPQQNPYVTYSQGSASFSHDNAADYIARDTGLPHVIDHNDLCYRLFTEHGFTWGGDWDSPKDYQHFDKRA